MVFVELYGITEHQWVELLTQAASVMSPIKFI